MVNVCISAYCDPLHVGHLEYINRSKQLAEGGKLIVIVNNDRQASLKKGKSFMKENERVIIIKHIVGVDEVFLSIDEDRSVCASIRYIHENICPIDIFANGGDQSNDIIPEASVCNELGIKLVDGLGAKIQSSSWLTGLKPLPK